MSREQLNLVVVGHVDHGKSTVLGRLLADTGSLPDGKLEAIRDRCSRESKQFEYAFLLDALKDEQSQNITIDAARIHFKTVKRDYLILDAPGHIEFLKNMITGASHAQAALLVIDALEGVKENSRRHGYMLSLLGVKQVLVVVNKMDLVGYEKEKFESIVEEYSSYLADIGVTANGFIPASAFEGENISKSSENMGWFDGMSVLEAMDSFVKPKTGVELPARMPVQDIYRFTQKNDSRRIIAGKIETGSFSVGDDVVFYPSGKGSKIKTFEDYKREGIETVEAGYCTGVTLVEQIYVSRGQMMCKKADDMPKVSRRCRANIFWMGDNPLMIGRAYILKICTHRTDAKITKINKVLDCSSLESSERDHVEKNMVAECEIQCDEPIAFDLSTELNASSRFVLVDEFEVRGGGIITKALVDKQQDIRDQVYTRESRWYSSDISYEERASVYRQKPTFILITGPESVDKKPIGRALERMLFTEGVKVYYLGIGNLLRGLSSDIQKKERHEHVRRLGEVAHLMMDAGLIVIATASDLAREELDLLKTIINQDEMLSIFIDGKNKDLNESADLSLDEGKTSLEYCEKIRDKLVDRDVIEAKENG